MVSKTTWRPGVRVKVKNQSGVCGRVVARADGCTLTTTATNPLQSIYNVGLLASV